MNPSIAKYSKKFQKLRVDRSHGIAPHKPILLLAILQSYDEGTIKGDRIYLSPELVAMFKSIWSQLVTTNHDCRISYPFFYMKSEGFWRLIPKKGFGEIEKMGSLMKSFSSLSAAVAYAQIDQSLYELCLNSKSNQTLKQQLLDEYFPVTKHRFSGGNTSGSIFKDLEGKFLNEPPAEYQRQTKLLLEDNEEEEVFLRGSVFKREIPKIYDSRCCISGLRVDSIHNFSMIDACHIVPFSESYDDTVTNGLALCPNLHRAFDRGLISIALDYRVCVSDSFVEEGDYSIRQYDGQKINLPSNQSYWANQKNLEWHKQYVFK
ncbi:MAG: HNH endonuclease [Cyclobacteriaceae bacterium]